MQTANSHNVAILSTASALLLPRLINSLDSVGLNNLTIILDEKDLNEKDRGIESFRTGGALDDSRFTSDALKGEMPQVFFVSSHNAQECVDLLRKSDVMLTVNWGTPRKLKGSVLNASKLGAINVHPGILPAYRGSCCVEWAIYNDDQIGNTSHIMTEEYDAGAIIEIERYTFPQGTTYNEIRSEVYESAVQVMLRAVMDLVGNKYAGLAPQIQEEGVLYPPIPDEQMGSVLRLIESGEYSFLTKG